MRTALKRTTIFLTEEQHERLRQQDYEKVAKVIGILEENPRPS